MMQDVQTIELEITDVAYRGKGVGRLDSIVVFVAGALPGERVRASVTARKRRFLEAELEAVLSPSPHRVEPFCDLYGTCPGCTYQHVAYDEEVRIKERQLTDLLARLGGSRDAVLLQSVPSPLDRGYRNKAVLHTQCDADGARLGYYGSDNRTVIDVNACPIAHPELNGRLVQLRSEKDFAKRLRDHRQLTLRHSSLDGAHSWWDKPNSKAQRLFEASAVGKIRVPRGSFFQVNLPVADLTVSAVAGRLKEIGPENVVDLYCGVGLFALSAAQLGVPHVLGIDSDGHAIQAAHRNAAKLEVGGVEFVSAPASAVVADALRAVPPEHTALILDPPRRGLDRGVLDQICTLKPADLIYVSCAADTLARDIAALRAAGYGLPNAQLFDMFPRTAPFETVAWLTTRPQGATG